MDQAAPLWAWWPSLVFALLPVFTQPGWGRVVQWVTGMVWCWEEPTMTQSLTALGVESRWRVLEPVAEYGAWDRAAVERQTLRGLEQERPARWGRDHPVAVDDTQGHRTSQHVWGTCTCHASSARSPHRATTVRAHHGVVRGDLLPGRPWTSLPHGARWYGRTSQLPAGETFQTTTAVAVEVRRQAEAESAAPILGVRDGAYAVATVLEPCLQPRPAQRRSEVLTRLRVEARLEHAAGPQPWPRGRRPLWGPRLPAPPHHLYGAVAWRQGRAWV